MTSNADERLPRTDVINSQVCQVDVCSLNWRVFGRCALIQTWFHGHRCSLVTPLELQADGSIERFGPRQNRDARVAGQMMPSDRGADHIAHRSSEHDV